jgi:hypothetical protein
VYLSLFENSYTDQRSSEGRVVMLMLMLLLGEPADDAELDGRRLGDDEVVKVEGSRRVEEKRGRRRAEKGKPRTTIDVTSLKVVS